MPAVDHMHAIYGNENCTLSEVNERGKSSENASKRFAAFRQTAPPVASSITHAHGNYSDDVVSVIGRI